jgi:ABC-type sugar transport system ATPase subunit
MTQIRLDKVTKQYQAAAALNEICLTIHSGEFLMVVGPSGSGKTTLLRLIAGLETSTRGRILFNDKPVDTIPPQQRDVAMIFPHPVLYPHLSGFDNIAFGAKARGQNGSKLHQSIHMLAEKLEIQSMLHRKPETLSAGQRQRIAIASVLIRTPKVFLFDEPMNHLDGRLRETVGQLIDQVRQRTKTTIICVSHQPGPMIALADRVCILQEGKIHQLVSRDEYLQVHDNLKLY